jgi:hypothetical protein
VCRPSATAHGVCLLQPGDHVPSLGLGPDGEFDSRSLVPGVGYAAVGSEIWLYYSAHNRKHIAVWFVSTS